MIFVTVGTQLPFDRMVRTIDQWASAHPYAEAFAQIGPADYKPKFMPWAEFLDADECRRKTEQADVVVAHAGMGSILTALELGRPVLVMPRLSALGEHRNDHQLDTAKKLLAQGRIFVAFNEDQLLEKLAYLKTLRPTERIPVQASSSLLAALRAFAGGQQLEMPAIDNLAEIASLDAVGLDARPKLVRSPGSRQRTELVEAPGNGFSARRVRTPALSIRSRQLSEESPDALNRFRLTSDAGRLHTSRTIKSQLAGVILLAGRLRATELSKRIGRSRLDLPIDSNRSILAYWRDEAAQLAKAWDCRKLAIRVLLDQASFTPTLPAGVLGITLSIERDQAEYRGTGGVLRDACAGYDDDAWVLVANAAQILYKPLHEAVETMADSGGEINVVNDQDGVPIGLVLLKCGVLRAVPDIGFLDMKEQVVPALAGSHRVKVIPSRGVTSAPIHTLKDYTSSLRRYHGRSATGVSGGGAFDERWQSQFSIREQGSVVAGSAVMYDSVVLEGGAVEKDAVIVRSVVGRGARVAPGQVVIDQIVN